MISNYEQESYYVKKFSNLKIGDSLSLTWEENGQKYSLENFIKLIEEKGAGVGSGIHMLQICKATENLIQNITSNSKNYKITQEDMALLEKMSETSRITTKKKVQKKSIQPDDIKNKENDISRGF